MRRCISARGEEARAVLGRAFRIATSHGVFRRSVDARKGPAVRNRTSPDIVQSLRIQKMSGRRMAAYDSKADNQREPGTAKKVGTMKSALIRPRRIFIEQ
jgi:hypothetical protein